MSSLQSKIEALAETFAAGVLAAVRSSSLAEVLGGGDGAKVAVPKRGPGRQKALKLDKKEITRPLEQALSEKKITKKGQKRNTTYFAK